MEISTLLSTVISVISPLLKSKSITTVSDDLSEAANGTVLDIWKKIKPIFIKDEDFVDALQEHGATDDLIQELTLKIKRQLIKDSNFKSELETLLQKNRKDRETGIQSEISNSKNVNLGNISTGGGDVRIGDDITEN